MQGGSQKKGSGRSVTRGSRTFAKVDEAFEMKQDMTRRVKRM